MMVKKKEKIGAIIQARMSSKRLPGKTLKLINGIPILEHVILKIKKSRFINTCIVATTKEKEDLKIINFCKRKSHKYFIGDKNDVLSRFYHCAKKNNLDTIVRITSDNPLVDMSIVDKTINMYKGNYDYVANNIIKTFPHGLDVEVFNFKSLEKSFLESKSSHEREHVTQYIRHNPKKFKISNYASKINYSNIRVTVDTKEDLKLVRKIIRMEGIKVTFNRLIEIFKLNKELLIINSESKKEHRKYNKRNNII